SWRGARAAVPRRPCRDEHQVVAAQRLRAQLRDRRTAGDDRHVEIVSRDALGDFADRANLEPQVEVRMEPAELRQERRENIESWRGASAKANAADDAARHLLHALARAIDGRKNA